MPQPIDEISLSEDDVDTSHHIESELLRSLREDLPQAENRNFVLTAKDAQEFLVGGLVANTSYGWLLVKSLWIATACRRRSVGRTLLERAEEKGRLIGCHAAWLDTSNPDAKQFYSKLGYTIFGELANENNQHPADHRRWFMKKTL